MSDVKEQKWLESHCSQIMDNIQEVLWETDARLVFTYISPRDIEQRGYQPSEIIGRNFFTFLADASQQQVMKAVTEYAMKIQQGAQPPLVLRDVQQIRKDGRTIWTEVVASPLMENGIVSGFVGSTRDLTELKLCEEKTAAQAARIEQLTAQLESASAVDRLTGVFRRDRLEAIWNQESTRVTRYRITLSVVLVNVDSFRQINETHGIVKGDEVLAEMGQMIGRFIRDSDSVFRWTNDEFLLLLPHTTRDQSRIQAERMRQAIEQHKFPIPDKVTISVGITEFVNGENLETTVTRADQALYIAKRAGHNQVEVR